MSFLYDSNNKKDNEQRKFQPDSAGNVAVNVIWAEGSLAFSKSEVTLAGSSTTVIDVNLLSSFSRLDYIINFKDSPVTVTKSMRLAVQNNAGVLTSVISERLGGSLNVLLNTTEDSVDAFLEVTNNESFPLTMTFLKSKI